jgi:hypothetical protein
MAIIANTYLTFDAKGIREQLADVIYMISPEEVPLTSMMAKQKVSGTLQEWQTDVLGAVDLNNKQRQGNDYTSFASVTPTVRVGNYQQISVKTLIVSGTEEEVEKAGRRSDLNRETVKRGAELKRDIESIVFNPQGGVAGNETTPPETATLLAWVKTNTDFGAGGSDPVYTSGVPSAARVDGTQRNLDETITKAVIQSLWTEGGQIRFLFVGPVNKQKASAFAGIATKNYDLSGEPRPTAIIGAADVYVSDFGYLSILPSRWQRERDAWFIDPEWLQLDHLRPFRRIKLAKTGDAEKRLLLQEWGLRVKQEAGLGLAADLSTV